MPDVTSDALNAVKILNRLSFLSTEESLVMIKNYCLQSTLGKYNRIPLITPDGTEGDTGRAEELSEIEKQILLGESERLEFKAGWQYSHHTNGPNKDISSDIIKTLSAFMNTLGGTLIIGVQDDGEICGLEESDFKLHSKLQKMEKIDKIKRNIDDMFDFLIGSQHTSLKNIYIEQVNGKTLLVIGVKISQRPVYVKLDKTESFYVRSSASTRELSGSQMVEYINDKFYREIDGKQEKQSAFEVPKEQLPDLGGYPEIYREAKVQP